jgi:hypothetical protein
MITDKQFQELKCESILSSTFTMGKDENGQLWVVFGNHIVDHITFKVFLLWKLAGHTSYKRIMDNRKDHVKFLRSINHHDLTIQKNNKGIVDFLYREFDKSTSTDTNTHIISKYKEYISE